MTQEKTKQKEHFADRFQPIVSSKRRDLESIEDLEKPNAYRNDWTQVADRSAKDNTEGK